MKSSRVKPNVRDKELAGRPSEPRCLASREARQVLLTEVGCRIIRRTDGHHCESTSHLPQSKKREGRGKGPCKFRSLLIIHMWEGAKVY